MSATALNAEAGIKHIRLDTVEAVKISMFIGKELKEDLQVEAKRLGISYSELMRQVCAAYLDMPASHREKLYEEIKKGVLGTVEADNGFAVISRKPEL